MEVLKRLHKLLKQDQSIKELVTLALKAAPAIASKSPEEFSVSAQYESLFCEFQKLKFDLIKETFKELPVIPCTTAIIIKATKDFTLALLMIPSDKYFDWHDHHLMNGISCCVSGQLEIRSLDPTFMKPNCHQKQRVFSYPKQKIREEILNPWGQRFSVISPESYNIHQIHAKTQSCFLDLLMPEYPDDECHYFRTIDTNKNGDEEKLEKFIYLEKVSEQQEQVFGIEALVKHFRQCEKVKLKLNKL